MKRREKPIVALMYDFDRTLAITDMQNFKFIPSLGFTPAEFWAETEKFCKGNDMDKILGYMYTMIVMAKKKGISLTREYLQSCGKEMKFFDGVLTWFDRINKYGEEKGIIIEHYLITSGNTEILEGSSIIKEFKKVFGCEFLYDDKTKEAYWPKTIVNYTLKTQYIFRINKGVIDTNDDKEINEKSLKKRIPYTNMIYIGDGFTDVPSMIVVKENGGNSIAVHDKGHQELVSHLYEDNRVNYICEADYRSGKQIDKIVKLIIDSIVIRESLQNKQEEIEKVL
ncbi:MAG TPA: hypothetical protein VJY64_02045 [Candidatus Onthovivens sp.]|nr:hypothetical protein [Candidatus Onthovivens sp.]